MNRDSVSEAMRYRALDAKGAKEEGERMRSLETLLNFPFQNSTLRRLVID